MVQLCLWAYLEAFNCIFCGLCSMEDYYVEMVKVVLWFIICDGFIILSGWEGTTVEKCAVRIFLVWVACQFGWLLAAGWRHPEAPSSPGLTMARG